MDNRTLKWIADIDASIEEIQEFLEKNTIQSFAHYSKNRLLKRAVERDLAIIGEAVNKVKQENPAVFEAIPHAKSIIALRNHIVHAYDSISDESIWSILVNHLPKLHLEVKKIVGP